MRIGDVATYFLMHIFIVVIGVKVFGWIAILVGLGIYVVGFILNYVHAKIRGEEIP